MFNGIIMGRIRAAKLINYLEIIPQLMRDVDCIYIYKP